MLHNAYHFFRNPLSRVEDLALIEYEVKNRHPHPISCVRMMLDTLLGQNDKPFRIKDVAYQSEQLFKGNQIAAYFQAFDSLNNPRVIAQVAAMRMQA